MLTVWELNALQKEVSETNINKWKVGKNISWVDCFKPTEEEFDLLSKKTGVPVTAFKESIDPKKRARVIPLKQYSTLVFHEPYALQGVKETVPIGIFLVKNCIITIHDQEIISTEKLRNMPKEQLYESMKPGASNFACILMDAVSDDFFSLLDQIDEDISMLEDQVITAPTKMIIETIFIQKRKLIFMHKALIANREVLSALEKRYIPDFDKSTTDILRDLCADVTQLIELASTYRDILTSILDLYLSSISNSLNQVMKILTIISAFILVPTLIAGIYGMNFQKTSSVNMPELYWEFGYPFAICLMLLSILIFYLWFKKKGWI